MDNTKWLLANADTSIRYNLDQTIKSDELMRVPEIIYWMNFLKEYYETEYIQKIHGSHDYRYENIMGKLIQLGINSDIESFHNYMSLYINYLSHHIERDLSSPLDFGKIYQSYDYELILATFLAMSGYIWENPVQFVIQKRIKILYSFTNEKRYDIYIDGSKLTGVKKEWKNFIIDPDLYADGNIHLPTVHDYILLSVVMQNNPDLETTEKINTIVQWLFNKEYRNITKRYGYFYIPGGNYSTKAICWKYELPEIPLIPVKSLDLQCLIQRVYTMSNFKICKSSDWFNRAISYLNCYKKENGHYLFPKEMLIEKKDGFWIFGAHMGMGEDRKKKLYLEIESTYWMERIFDNLKKWTFKQKNT